jgi:anti-sigma B factor antagonist
MAVPDASLSVAFPWPDVPDAALSVPYPWPDLPFLTVHRLDTAAATRVIFGGELDLATREQAEAALLAAEAAGRPLIIDLSPLSFMDCQGLGLLLAARKRAEAAGRALRLILGPIAARVLGVHALEHFETAPPA